MVFKRLALVVDVNKRFGCVAALGILVGDQPGQWVNELGPLFVQLPNFKFDFHYKLMRSLFH